MADNEALNRRLEDLEQDTHQGSLMQRVERLERRWHDIWNDPAALVRRAAELLDGHQRELAFLAMVVTSAAIAVLDRDHNLDGVRDFLHV